MTAVEECEIFKNTPGWVAPICELVNVTKILYHTSTETHHLERHHRSEYI